MRNTLFQFTAVGALSLTTLFGCGGGGSGGSSAAPTPPSNPAPPPNNATPFSERLSLTAPSQIETNQSVGLIASVSSGPEITLSR